LSLGADLFCTARQAQPVTGSPPALQAVLADVSRRPAADARDVQVLRIERKEWPDTGLGCPRPGQIYSQVMTPGWLIELRSGQKIFEYHTDSGENFVLCAQR
jgi:hypothetical protein